jgi:acyl carrier protein
MTNKEIVNLIEDTLEMDIDSLTENTMLKDISEYDSMAKLSIIVLADDDFSKKLTGEIMRNFVTIGDIVNFLK